ncbi:MAG: winged helix-turn-helix transcriptional regulator [candidate division WOR-3 bacterium]|nr:MAG: winged helix-turn-helix transcriptional regulator [candidate division WOR-3 bacterium]
MRKEMAEIKAAAFSALAHPLRLKILDKLRDGPCCVCKITPYVGGEQSNVSHHLAILRKSNIVRSEKRGLEVWYEVTDRKIFDIVDLMNNCVITHLRNTQDILGSATRE